MDRIFYTNEITKEELFETLNILLSKFVRELYDQELEIKTKNDDATTA